jgi:hypothetical protein
MKKLLMVCAGVALLAIGMHHARANSPPGSLDKATSAYVVHASLASLTATAPAVIVDVPVMRMEAIPITSEPMTLVPALFLFDDGYRIGAGNEASLKPYIDARQRASRLRRMDGAHRARDASI